MSMTVGEAGIFQDASGNTWPAQITAVHGGDTYSLVAHVEGYWSAYGPSVLGQWTADATPVPFAAAGNYTVQRNDTQTANLAAQAASAQAAADATLVGAQHRVPWDTAGVPVGFWLRDSNPASATFNELSITSAVVRSTNVLGGAPFRPSAVVIDLTDDIAAGMYLQIGIRPGGLPAAGWLRPISLITANTHDQGTPGARRLYTFNFGAVSESNFPAVMYLEARTPGGASTTQIIHQIWSEF